AKQRQREARKTISRERRGTIATSSPSRDVVSITVTASSSGTPPTSPRGKSSSGEAKKISASAGSKEITTRQPQAPAKAESAEAEIKNGHDKSRPIDEDESKKGEDKPVVSPSSEGKEEKK